MLASPCCLVLDVNMPGLNGLDLQTVITVSRSKMPIIFVSGFGDVPMTVKALKGGALDFLTKRRNGIAVRTSFTNALAPVNGDRVQLQQVMNNLLRNAIDAVSVVKDRLRFIEIGTEIDEDAPHRTIPGWLSPLSASGQRSR